MVKSKGGIEDDDMIILPLKRASSSNLPTSGKWTSLGKNMHILLPELQHGNPTGRTSVLSRAAESYEDIYEGFSH